MMGVGLRCSLLKLKSESLFVRMCVGVLALSVQSFGYFMYEIFDHHQSLKYLKRRTQELRISDPELVTAFTMATKERERGIIVNPYYIWNGAHDVYDE
jgi:hypothetical protein